MTPEMDPIDWSTSYSQYLARSAAISARTLNLYQLALERVSRGDLPATIFQDHFPIFAVTHGAEFTNRFAEVGSRFLSDLVRLGSSFSQQPPEVGGPAVEFESVPPRFDPSNPMRWYEQIAEYVGQLNARAVNAYRRASRRIHQEHPSGLQHCSRAVCAKARRHTPHAKLDNSSARAIIGA